MESRNRYFQIIIQAACQFHWHEIRRRRKSEDGQKFPPQLPSPPAPRLRRAGFLPARLNIKKSMFKNPIVKNILSAVAVAGFGFILLNLTFLLDFLFQSLVLGFIKLFTPADLMMTYNWFPPMMHAFFMVVIGLISWPIFRSKFGVLYKAIYMTVPLAVVFVTLGIFLYRWPIAAYSIGSLFSIGILYYLYRTKQPWLYYYAVILVGLAMLLVGLVGVEI